MARPVIERYRDRLPVTASTPVVALGEGSTPLVRLERLGAPLGVTLWAKLELANPTGSFKDRGMTVAVSKALEEGAQALICASTGNTASSAAAYAARAGIPAVVLQPAGAVAAGKLAQSRALGARVLEVRGSFDEALAAAMALAERGTHAFVNSVNPYRLEGQKTAIFEIVEELGGAPDAIYLPYGGGGNATAYGKGVAELGVGTAVVPVQAADRAGTIASAIRIAHPVHAHEVEEVTARTESSVVTVDDDAILAAWRDLARLEGVFCEPSSAAGLAGLRAHGLDRGAQVVVVLTGHGLKDPEVAVRYGSETLCVDPDPDAIAAVAG
jgi:threonine synthase